MLPTLLFGLFEYDAPHALLKGDAASATVLDQDPAALAAGVPLATLLPRLHSDEPPPVGLLPAAGACWVASLVMADGQRREVQFQRHGAGGVMLEVTAIRQQAQRLQEAEALNSGVMSCSVDCIKLLSLDGTLESMNPGGLAVMEIEDFAGFAGTYWAAFWPPAHREQVVEALACARAGGVGRFTGMAPTAKGSERWWDVVVTPILDSRQGPIRLLAISRDVTASVNDKRQLDELNRTLEARIEARSQELQNLEAELRQAQKMEAIGQLTGGVAHDFNNLLTGIVGSLDLLRRRVRQGRFDELERYLDTAERSAESASALTHRLLAFARRQVLEAQAVELAPLLAGMRELLRHSTGKAVRQEVELPVTLWTLQCDPHQLENALLNLAINARDAMPDGGTLHIAAANVSGPLPEVHADEALRGDFVRISVSDTGCGMDADTRERACEPFFTTKPSGRGTGLGLSMIYGFARQSGGAVAIESTPGRGTSIHLYLPRRLPGQRPVPVVAAISEAPLPAISGDCALIVEEEDAVRAVIGEVLAELGYTPVAVADSATAASMLASGVLRIDLLVTSLGLAGLDGRQLAERARARYPAIPVLYLSGQTDPAQLPELTEPGMALIAKPFGLEELAATVRGLRPGS